jgi:broad specificity phosphatase PhoE
MTRIYLVRHGRAAASWDDDLDPGLDSLGVSQAEAAAETLSAYRPLDVLSSPLKRALETSLRSSCESIAVLQFRVSSRE